MPKHSVTTSEVSLELDESLIDDSLRARCQHMMLLRDTLPLQV